MEMDDLEDIILDEIALEGLNGVSLERLWILLEQRHSPFPLQCDERTKNFIWQDLLCHHHSISFYRIPEQFQQQLNENAVEEKTPVKMKKKKTSSKITLQSNQSMIDDPITKDRGNCPCYNRRTNVTAEIRKEAGSDFLSLQQVTSKWGKSLVLVASQEARLHALVSQVTTADVPLEQSVYYCCLEYVGRCRYLGASQASLSTLFDVDFSYVFHMCKILLKEGVVFKETTGNLANIFLMRFRPQSHITRKIKCAEKILDYLTNQPIKMAPRYELVEHCLQSEDEEVSYNQFKKALQGLKSSNLVEAVAVPAKDLPQFSSEEVVKSLAEHLKKIKSEEGDNADKGKKPEDFIITCIRLIEQSSTANNNVEDNDDDDETDLDLKSRMPEIDFSRLCSGLELTDAQHVYCYVEKNQTEMNGVSINDTMHALMMDRYRVRLIFRRFCKHQTLKSITFVNGKIRESRFFTQRYLDEGTVPEHVLQLYHQEEKKPSKDEMAAANHSFPEAGGSSDYPESAQGGLQPTSKSQKVSKDKSPAGKTKGVSQMWKNMERGRLILEHVAQVRVIEGHLLHKHVKKTEAEMGSKTECCRKSLFRMLTNLTNEGKLNYFTKEIQRKGRANKEIIKIVSDKSIGDDDPQVHALLDSIIIKPTFAPQPVKMPALYRKLKKTENKSIAMSDLLKIKMQHTHEKRKLMERYGYKGKMERLDALHKFLWYLLYEEKKEVNEAKLEPVVTLTPGDKVTAPMAPGWLEKNGGQDVVVAKSLKSVMASEKKKKTGKQAPQETEQSSEKENPPTHIEFYLDTNDWRRYVPPGKGHAGRVKGWATMNDILTYIPLSLYVQINSVIQPIPGLDEALQHPQMRHYPISALHIQLFNSSTIKRTVTNIHTCLMSLSGMGLMYFDRDQRCQLRNQVNFYLCRSGSLLDTTSSAAGYDQVEDKEYPRRSYTFSSLEDVKQFWLDFKMTCFSTPLGVIKLQSATKERKENKPLMMIAESIHEAPPDPHTIPGDHRGAGGLDTTFYAHRSGNWDTIRCKKAGQKKTAKVESMKKDETENEVGEKDTCEVKVMRVSAKEHKKATVGGKGQKRKTSKGKAKSHKGKTDEEGTPDPGVTESDPVQDASGSSNVEILKEKVQKAKKVRPKSKSKTHLARNRHIYDKEDLLASQRKILRRVKWSAREDNLLLLCGLSLRILKNKCAKGDTVKRFVGWSVIRDILQENLEESNDKTAAAAARRFRTLLKDHTNMSNFSVCLTDIYSDKEIMSEFMSRKKDYEDEKVREQEFRELWMILAKKFECRDKSEIFALPSSLEGLYEKYDLMNSNLPVATTMEEFELMDVKSDEEITFSILSKIVLISMLSHHFKRHDMKEIYFALRQYDTAMLQKAVDLFKSHGFMGRNRNGIMDVVNTKRAMHVVPMSFQFTKTFFNLFNASAIPSKVLEETSTILSEILAACKQASNEASLDGDEMPTICIDDMKGNKTSIFCIPALDMASDTVDIPRDIISLDLSASEKVRLKKKHEEEMRMEVEEGDLEEEDDDLPEKPREAKRKASEISEDVGSRKMIRQFVGDVARRKVAFVRTAHKEWRQTLTDKQASEPEKIKGAMSSLIPRLLKNMEKQKSDDASSKTTEPSMEPGIVDTTAQARHSFALDHDYFSHEADRTPDSSQDVNSSEASCQQTSEEAEASFPSTVQVDNASAPCTSLPEEELAFNQFKAPDSFFTWLTMRGLLTQEYSKKPQNIHEDITVRRCSIHLKMKACLLRILEKYHVSSKQEPHDQGLLHEEDISQRSLGSQLSNPKSEDQFPNTTKQNPSEPVGQHSSYGKIIPQEKTSCLLWPSERKSRTMNTYVPGHIESLGELICYPCGPIQTFRSPTPNSILRPMVEYRIREPCKGLEDICKGHEHNELLGTIHQLVKSRGSLGLTYPQLLNSLGHSRQHTRTTVFKCLRVLLQEQLILEVGTTVVRLVVKKFASVWLLKSMKSISVSTATPLENSGFIHPAKKAKVSEKSISQERVNTNGEHAVRDDEHEIRRDGEGLQEEGALPPSQVDLPTRTDNHESLQESSIACGGEIMMVEGDKRVLEKDESDRDETMSADGDDSSLTSEATGKKRKKAERKETKPLEVRYEPVTILSHPWTNIDGSVNYQSLVMFLSSFALLFISKPGMKESDVFSHFQNVMAPVECLHLIKILVNADIITRHSSYMSMKLNLFGPPLNTKPKPSFFYQPSVAALMNLALLKDNLIQSEAAES